MTTANTEVVTDPATPPPANPPGNEQDPPVLETVSKTEFERVQQDMHRFKAEAKAAKELADRLKMQGLKEKDDWKVVAQEYETKYKEAEQQLKGLNAAIVTDKKMAAIKLEAKKSGVLDSALDDLELVDFPEVDVETTSTGRVNVIGADRAVQRLKAIRPHWFGRSAPNINSNAPGVNQDGNKVSYEELMKMETECRKTGNWTGYREKLLQYQQQK